MARTGMKRQEFAQDLHRDDAPPDWREFIIRPADEKHSNLGAAPCESGIYAWYTPHGHIMYVGRSGNIYERLRKHMRRTLFTCGKLQHFSYRLVPARYLNGVEMAHIKTLSPPENMSRQAGVLSFWDEFCAEIEGAWRDELPRQREWTDRLYTDLANEVAARIKR